MDVYDLEAGSLEALCNLGAVRIDGDTVLCNNNVYALAGGLQASLPAKYLKKSFAVSLELSGILLGIMMESPKPTL